MVAPTDRKHYLVIADYGKLGRSYYETDVRLADRESIVQALLTAQIDTPVNIVCFDPAECDVSTDIAEELVNRSWRGGYSLSPGVAGFCERHDVDVPAVMQDLEN